MLVLLMNYFSSQLFELVRRFFDKEHFYKQHKAKIGNNKKRKKEKQEISNNLAQNFCYLKIIHFLHRCYYPELLWDILKKIAKEVWNLF